MLGKDKTKKLEQKIKKLEEENEKLKGKIKEQISLIGSLSAVIEALSK